MKTNTKNIMGNVMPAVAVPVVKKAGTLIKDTILGVAAITYLSGYSIYYFGKKGINAVKSAIDENTTKHNN